MRERVRIGSRYGRSGYGAETCDTVIWLKGYVMFRNLKTLMCEMRVVIFYGGSHVRGSSLDDNGGKSGKSGDFKSVDHQEFLVVLFSQLIWTLLTCESPRERC